MQIGEILCFESSICSSQERWMCKLKTGATRAPENYFSKPVKASHYLLCHDSYFPLVFTSSHLFTLNGCKSGVWVGVNKLSSPGGQIRNTKPALTIKTYFTLKMLHPLLNHKIHIGFYHSLNIPKILLWNASIVIS